ncbi:MAG: tRNA threonylcarbamoyladenosine dehydratase [Clostridiales bacterium]|nr:tRNA threonylcarbamoyladenosine dehydratase [Clostridiales bacterium]
MNVNETAFSRTEELIGKQSFEKLVNKKIIIFGVGGVGSFVCEAIARTGIRNIALVDSDKVSLTNINRQIIALHSTIGKSKTSVMKQRILDINPLADVEEFSVFFNDETKDKIDFSKYDYIIDCIDSVNSKVLLIKCAKENGIPIISSMGTGNKLNPQMLEIADIKDTSYCPLARAVRNKLKKENIYSLTVVYSKEQPLKSEGVPKSCAFVPSAAGLLMASYVIRELIK